jgi:sterol desaturase/sphingolipid hydroxylase (fatty acid hydroxylase superfamily)
MDRVLGYGQKAIDLFVHHFFTVSVFLILAAWLSAVIGAVIYYVWQHDADNKSFRNFVRYSLPKEIWLSKSSKQDMIFIVINYFTEPLTVVPFAFVTGGVSLATYRMLGGVFGVYEPGPANLWLTFTMFIVIILVQDFMTWWTHYLEHKVPLLWEIHKVHHSLQVMTPLSNRRHHPWQLVWEGGMTNFASGIVLGATSYVFRVPILDTAFMGMDAYFVASILSFYQLRHSHIPLNYGRLEKWFLSPAQHQLHHSFEVRDWDLNFSLLLSIWDRMFGTINYVYTQPTYKYRIGLPPQYAGDYDKVWKFFFIPWINQGKIIMKWLQRSKQPIARLAEPVE